jgi:hypothetical protein
MQSARTLTCLIKTDVDVHMRNLVSHSDSRIQNGGGVNRMQRGILGRTSKGMLDTTE